MLDEIKKIVARATMDNERDVKRVARRILTKLDVFHFMPPANAYGKVGISDILVVGGGRPIAIETKYGTNKPTINQKLFGQQWADGGGLFVVVTDRNIVDRMDLVNRFVEGAPDVRLFNPDP